VKTVGLIPAAGLATRLGRLPCSKEILPVPGPDGALRPLCTDLLEAFSIAGIREVYVVVRQGKWDIPALLGDGADYGLHIAYLVTAPTRGSLETVDRAWPFVHDCRVALGFPDLLFSPRDVFSPLLERAGEADVVLGLFPTDEPERCDLEDLAPEGRVRGLEIKPRCPRLSETWMFAVWNPPFTRLLHRHAGARGETHDRHVGEAVQVALREGLRVRGVRIPGGWARDLGTREALARHWRGG
jgi:glucose-1-phosphate thymidylyltransferase